LGEGRITGLELDKEGALWAATAGGLSRVKDGRVATLTSKNGLPCDRIHWAVEDDAHSFWLYTACGLVRIARSELDAWVADPKRIIQSTTFDSSDGVRLRAIAVGEYTPRVAKAADGKLWFLPFDGVNVIDPRHIPVNKLPPPVHIEQIIADRRTYESSSNLRLPPLIRDLEIDYTALSLVAPEKIRFRVKLEGRDPDWKDIGNERKAFYNDLPPRSYRFRVMASNNSGVWNEAGDSLDFSIAAAYYQTAWFQASCAAAFLGLLWALYRYRLHQIAQQFNVRLDERVNERTRIARELHDTLLQSFQALMIHFQAVDNLLPPGKGKEALETVLDRADQAIAEGRDAIQNIRTSAAVTNELSHAMTALGEELAGSRNGENSPATFRVSVEGTPWELHPILRDDIYRIAREALGNAFRHAQASQIEADITYGESLLKLRIRDDGKGIDPKHLHSGRDGHWGLPGMRERAREIGAQLEMWSEVGAGTEVELRVPGSIAYQKARRSGGLKLFRKNKKGSDER
jgi:signal transduction histidine kinase